MITRWNFARRIPAHLLVLPMLLALFGDALAIHRETPFLVNASDRPGRISTNPGPSHGLPARIAFHSADDLLDNGSVGSEIYVYILTPNNELSGTLGQITNFDGDSTNPTATEGARLVAFESMAPIVGETFGTQQLYLWIRSTNQYVQLTRGQAPSSLPNLDGKGWTVAYQSRADLKQGGGLGVAQQIFVHDLTGGPFCDITGCRVDPTKLIQITDAAVDSANPELSADGKRVFFESAAPLLGVSNGFTQIFMADLENGGMLTQITNGLGDSRNPGPVPNGSFVAFESEGDLLGLGPGGRQIYVYDLERGVLKQVSRGPGEAFAPSFGTSVGISFIGNGDLLGVGMGVGDHLFFFEPRVNQLFQVTRDPGTTSANAVARGNFIVFDSDEDIMRTGMTGRQVYSFNSEGRIPKPFIGKKLVDFVPSGGARLEFGTRDLRAETPMAIAESTLTFPPFPVAGYGTFCLRATGPATGVLSCSGGRSGGDLIITQDHMTNDIDPLCLTPGSCREGETCPQLQPHLYPCTTVGCIPEGVCNGPVRTLRGGNYKPGGAELSIPITVSLSLDDGLDGEYCTDDDEWVVRDNVETLLELTTGGVKGSILNANAVPGAILDTSSAMGAVVGSAAGSFLGSAGGVFLGSPFDCKRLEKSNYQDVTFVGVLPLIDAITSPPGTADVIVPIVVPLLAGQPYEPDCYGPGCNVLTYCETDLECSDGNVCNGIETCVSNSCAPGSSAVCDDGNACNGVEQCDANLGCLPAAAPLDCDDGALCTFDQCTASGGCSHTFIPGCCLIDADCQDINVCNGTETCVAGDCVPGVTLVCGDGDACNGDELCDPALGCVAGVAPTCDDGARCTFDRCDPIFGCRHLPIPGCCGNDGDCRDNSVCNGLETCDVGLGNCLPGVTMACDDGDACNGIETCDPELGCQEATAPVCDDGAPCTADSCDPLLGCVSTSMSGCCLVDADCQDTSACNGLETCVAGDCLPGAVVPCDDGDLCNGVETCDPAGGCIPGVAPACQDDGAPCTNDICDPLLGCVHVAIPGCCTVDTDCSDSDVCNGDETCIAGTCFGGTPLVCDDGEVCNGAETCDPVLGCQVGTGFADPFTFEAIQCQINAFTFAFQDTPVEAFGRPRKKHALWLLVRKVRRTFDLPPDPASQAGRRKTKPKNSVRHLRRFSRRIDRLILKQIGVQAEIGPLGDMADELIGVINQFILNAPQP